MNCCRDCESVKRRVDALEPSAAEVLIKICLLWFLVPFVIMPWAAWTLDQRAQIWAQHPEWTREEVTSEVWRRQGWDEVSIWTWRPLADK